MRLDCPLFRQKKVRFYLKRDDLLHKTVSGNKWRKLKYNIAEARRQQKTTLLTFGGAYSNHLYATAAVGKLLGWRTIGIVRGEAHSRLNPTLAFAQTQGMQIAYLSRSAYKEKDTEAMRSALHKRFGDFYLLPEGGTNLFALQGCAEIVDEVNSKLGTDYQVFACACGTGGTLAGLLTALPPTAKAYGFSALKGGAFLSEEVNKLLAAANTEAKADWQIVTQYHFGGYAKTKPALLNFWHTFEQQFGVRIEPVYTAKMLYGLFEMIKNDCFAAGETIVALHTGGLQGAKSGKFDVPQN